MIKHPLEHVTFLPSVSYGRRVCSPGWYWDHRTPFHDYDLFYVASGQGTMTLGNETFALQKRSCVVMRPGDLPKATQDPKDRLTVLYLHFRLSGTSDLPEPFPFPRFTVIGEAFPAESMLHRLMDVLEFPAMLRELEFDSLMKQFFIHLFRLQQAPQSSPYACSAKQNQIVRRIVAIVRERGGVGIDIDQLAADVNMSPPYIGRLFRMCTGGTLREFIARTKIMHAADLLAHSRMNASEIAERLGYSDVYAFSKQFKRILNVAPSQYAAGLRASKPAPPPERPRP